MTEDSIEKITHMENEIKALRQQNKDLLRKLEEAQFGKTLKEAIKLIDSAALVKMVQGERNHLKLLLKMTCRVLGAEGASIILYDRETDELYFEAATGEKAEQLKQFRLKPHEGIAGYSFTTGEALAVGDVMKDPRFKKEIAEALGQKQKALIVAPLIYQQEVIGVMEAVKMEGEGTFSADDLEILTSIANFSSVLVRKSKLYADLYALFLLVLKGVACDKYVQKISVKEFINLSHQLERDRQVSEEFSDAVELASLVRQVCNQGPEEADLVRSVLDDFMTYFRERKMLGGTSAISWEVDQ